MRGNHEIAGRRVSPIFDQRTRGGVRPGDPAGAAKTHKLITGVDQVAPAGAGRRPALRLDLRRLADGLSGCHFAAFRLGTGNPARDDKAKSGPGPMEIGGG